MSYFKIYTTSLDLANNVFTYQKQNKRVLDYMEKYPALDVSRYLSYGRKPELNEGLPWEDAFDAMCYFGILMTGTAIGLCDVTWEAVFDCSPKIFYARVKQMTEDLEKYHPDIRQKCNNDHQQVNKKKINSQNNFFEINK